MIMGCKRGVIEDLELTIGQVPSTNEAALTPPMDWLAFRFGSQPTQDGVAMTPGSKHIRLKAQGWKLDKLLPVLARFEPGAELSGEIDADARSQIQPMDATSRWTEREWSWDGRMTLRKLTIAGLETLNQDRVVVTSMSLAGRVAAQQGQLSMDRLRLQSDIGELTATGDLPLSGLGNAPQSTAAGSSLVDHDCQIHGHLGSAAAGGAAAKYSSSARDGTQITGGRLDVNLKSEGKDDTSRHWTADAVIDGLTANSQGQVVSWNLLRFGYGDAGSPDTRTS